MKKDCLRRTWIDKGFIFCSDERKKVGQEQIEIDKNKLSVEELKSVYLAKYEMDELIDQAIFTANEEYKEDTEMLYSGDTIAFIPPVSGG